MIVIVLIVIIITVIIMTIMIIIIIIMTIVIIIMIIIIIMIMIVIVITVIVTAVAVCHFSLHCPSATKRRCSLLVMCGAAVTSRVSASGRARKLPPLPRQPHCGRSSVVPISPALH